MTASLVTHKEVLLHGERLTQCEDLLRFGRKHWLLELIEVLCSSLSFVLEALLESTSSTESLEIDSLLSFLLLPLLFFLLIRCLSIDEISNLVNDAKWTDILTLVSVGRVLSALSSGSYLLLFVRIDQTIWVLAGIIVQIFLLLLKSDFHHLELGIEPSIPFVEWKLDLFNLLEQFS